MYSTEFIYNIPEINSIINNYIFAICKICKKIYKNKTHCGEKLYYKLDNKYIICYKCTKIENKPYSDEYSERYKYSKCSICNNYYSRYIVKKSYYINYCYKCIDTTYMKKVNN